MRRLLPLILLCAACGSGTVTHLGADAAADTADVQDGADQDAEPADGFSVDTQDAAPEDVPRTEALACDSLHETAAVDTMDITGEIFPDSLPDAAPDTKEPAEPYVQDLEVEHEGDLEPWDRVLRLSFTHPGLTADKFIEKTRQREPEIVGLFGGAEPSAGTVLLHVGPGCDEDPEHAWLLVHGAGSHAGQSWIEPPDLLAQGHGKTWMDQGHCVFAITFPHPFGCNFNWGIQTAAAVQAVAGQFGVSELSIVAHSKGGVAVVAWLSGFTQDERGLAPPAPDLIRRLVLLGVPLGGMDWSFRHPNFNYPADLLGLTMPSSWDQILEWGVWKDILDQSIYGGAYAGVLQLTAAWDEVHGLAMWEQDWYTTYYGGQGFVSHSLGISHAIEQADFFMDSFQEFVTSEEIPVRIASGTNSMMNGVAWEGTGPSDGLVFKMSVETVDAIGAVESLKNFPLANHLDLLHRETVFDWINDTL